MAERDTKGGYPAGDRPVSELGPPPTGPGPGSHAREVPPEGVFPEDPRAQHEIDLRAARQALIESRQGLAVAKINHRIAVTVGGIKGKGSHPDQLAADVKQQDRIVTEIEGIVRKLLEGGDECSTIPLPSGLEVIRTDLERPQ